MSAAARNAVIQEHLQTLKLPAFRRGYEALARQACDGGWAYEDYLRELLDAEVRSRQERAAACRLREAHFPEVKTLDQIDWQALSGVSRPKILELASCEYVKRAEAVVFAVPIGTGKTHLAIALGVEAASAPQRRRVPACGRRGAGAVDGPRPAARGRERRGGGGYHGEPVLWPRRSLPGHSTLHRFAGRSAPP